MPTAKLRRLLDDFDPLRGRQLVLDTLHVDRIGAVYAMQWAPVRHLCYQRLRSGSHTNSTAPFSASFVRNVAVSWETLAGSAAGNSASSAAMIWGTVCVPSHASTMRRAGPCRRSTPSGINSTSPDCDNRQPAFS